MNNIQQKIHSILHNKTIRNGGFFALFSFFNKGISFILITLIARYISPSDYGELSLFNTLITLLGYFVGLSTAGYLSVSYFKEKGDRFKEDFGGICLITFFVFFIIFSLFLISYNWLSGLLKVSVQFLFIGLIISFSNVFVGLNLDYYRIREKLSLYGILSCSFAILNFILTIYLVVFKGCNWHGQVYALLVCNIIYAIIAFRYFLKNKLLRIPNTWAIYRKIIFWGLPIIPHLASAWIKQGMDRYIINNSHALADVGLFSFASTLSGIIVIIGVAFNQTNSVNLYQTLSSENSKESKILSLRRKEKYFALLYSILVFIIVVAGIFFIPLVMPQYITCIPFFVILSVSGYLQCLYFLYCNYLFYYDATKKLMYITFGSSIVHLLLSLWLTKYSLYLTSGLYVVSMLIVVVCVYQQSRKLLTQKVK